MFRLNLQKMSSDVLELRVFRVTAETVYNSPVCLDISPGQSGRVLSEDAAPILPVVTSWTWGLKQSDLTCRGIFPLYTGAADDRRCQNYKLIEYKRREDSLLTNLG
jgi:hypothetical protein